MEANEAKLMNFPQRSPEAIIPIYQEQSLCVGHNFALFIGLLAGLKGVLARNELLYVLELVRQFYEWQTMGVSRDR